jgi:hypothetical protein
MVIVKEKAALIAHLIKEPRAQSYPSSILELSRCFAKLLLTGSGIKAILPQKE